MKRGLSTVIATLIMVLFVLVAIGILWVVISNLISKESEIAKIKTEIFSENADMKNINFDESNNLKLEFEIEKIGGKIITKEEITAAIPLNVDVMSAVDYSGSMRCSITAEFCDINTTTCASCNGTWDGLGCNSDCALNSANCLVCGGVWMAPRDATQNANKELVNKILNTTGNSKVGFSVYANTNINSLSIDLVNNITQLKSKINSWTYPNGGTCICCGINDSFTKLKQSPDYILKTIIVMSDGEANIKCNSADPEPDAKLNAINKACEASSFLKNLTIHSVGIGSTADEITLKNISNCGRGNYYNANNVDQLIGIYESIASSIIQSYKSLNLANYLKVVFYDDSGNSHIEKIDIPEVLVSKKYSFDLTSSGLTGKIIKIEIYPVITTSSGKEVIGPMWNVWKAS